jgi:hypothetical protein
LEVALAYLDTDHIVSSLEHFMESYADEEWSDSGRHQGQLPTRTKLAVQCADERSRHKEDSMLDIGSDPAINLEIAMMECSAYAH